MLSASEITKGFKPVSLNEMQVFNPYYKAFNKSRKYPRFYQSTLLMAKKKNIPIYYWGVVEDCLVLLKKEAIHSPVLKAVLPPISLKNDISREKSVIELLRNAGMTLKFSEDDLNRFGYSQKDCIVDKIEFESILDAAEYGDPAGSSKTKKRLRNDLSAFQKLVDSSEIFVSQSSEMSLVEFKRCDVVYKNWMSDRSHRGLIGTHTIFRQIPIEYKKNFLFTYLKDETGGFIIWGISEQVGPKKVVINTRFRSYRTKVLRDPDAVLHHLECKHWLDKLGEGTIINYGTGLNKSLAQHKLKFKPMYIMQIYNIRAHNSLSWDEWRKCCPNKTTTGGLL